ncbi:ABC transporter permease [Nigerium sp.]|uniref:ABC transporter permease n=1 Tax=Nigerium sp. TaxID=2042655 RepID=UPI003221FFA8
MAILSPVFLTTQNLMNVGTQAAVVAILAFGQTFVIVSAGIDLSVGSLAALSAIVTGYSATNLGLPAWVAILLGIATGCAAGLVSGILISYGRLPAFIATMAMLSVGRGLALVLSNGIPVRQPSQVAFFGSTLGGWLPVPLLIMVILGVLAAFILNRTYLGRCMYAIGGNEDAARLSGINVARQKLIIYALSGTFSAIAGLVLAGRLVSGQPQAASGYELDAIAAVVIGGASLAGGKGRAFGTFIGALVLAVIRNGLNLLNVSSFWQQVVIGIVIALAVLTDTLRRKSA